jgi:predicted metal-dependent enzyme (double-stranded beta helix superfamily)
MVEQLRLHLPAPGILTAEQRYWDPLKYRCHLLHAESDGSFSVVALVWRPGQATPVHDPVRNDGPQTAISLHIYGTDVSRLGTSVRRTYDLPVVAGGRPPKAESNTSAW